MLSTEERKKKLQESGRKGGKAKVPKGFSTMDKFKLKENAAKGGKISKRSKKNG